MLYETCPVTVKPVAKERRGPMSHRPPPCPLACETRGVGRPEKAEEVFVAKK